MARLPASLLWPACLAASALGQGMPKWLPEASKDLFGELDEIVSSSKAAVYDEEACEVRAKLVKIIGPTTGPEKGQIMSMVLTDLGGCELRKANIPAALRRYESAISELNAPSEEALMQNTQFAPLVLLKQACSHLLKNAASRAAVEFRRARTVHARDKVKLIKNLAKGNKVPAGQEENFIEQVMTKSKGGGQEAQQVKHIARMLNTMDSTIDLIASQLKEVDALVVGGDDLLLHKQKRLNNGASLSVPGLLMEQVVDAEYFAPAKSLAEKAKIIAKEVTNAEDVKSPISIIKRTKEEKGCGKFTETCKIVKALPDLSSNIFGETRVIPLKANKLQALDVCDTNANVLVLLALGDGVTLTVAGTTQDLKAATPLVVDHCLEVQLKATSAVPVLAAQAWHPEVATIERTTEVRDRSTKLGLKEDEVKEVTKVMNEYGKKSWEKNAKVWASSPMGERLSSRLAAKIASDREAEAAAAEAKRTKDFDDDEDRKRGLKELERKREEKRLKAEAKEKERLRKLKEKEDERSKKDPWLLDPAVTDIEQRLQELRQARRDANAKLEFDETKELTKEINAQERALAKAIKKAEKAWRRTGGTTKAAEAGKEGQAAAADSKGTARSEPAKKNDVAQKELQAAEQKLKELKKKKAQAAEEEDFKLAKQLKKDQELLEKEIAALKVKAEL